MQWWRSETQQPNCLGVILTLPFISVCPWACDLIFLCLSFCICKTGVTMIRVQGVQISSDLYGIRTAPGTSHSLGGIFGVVFFLLKSQSSHICLFSFFPLPSPAPRFHLLRPSSWFSLLPGTPTHCCYHFGLSKSSQCWIPSCSPQKPPKLFNTNRVKHKPRSVWF